MLGAILGVAAARETVGDGAILLAVYSLGLAVPFWIAAGFSGAFMRSSCASAAISARWKRRWACC